VEITPAWFLAVSIAEMFDGLFWAGQEGFASANAAAGAAKVTIVAIGIDGSFEGENGDYR
jgi:hypothetical protein